MSPQKKALGRGLSALIPNIDKQIINGIDSQFINDIDIQNIVEIDINKVEPNKDQPRKNFDELSLKELANSIMIYGIIQPIVVRKKENYYEIVAGERRWRAARIVGISKIPIIVKQYSEQELLEISLIENIQREDLNPLEKAESYNKLIKEFGLTQEQISEKIGKSRPFIANSLRLLNLDSRVQKFIIENKITNGHARALLATDNLSLQFEIAQKIIKEDLNVRQTENLMKTIQSKNLDVSKNKSLEKEIIPIYKNLEREFSNIFGTKVRIIDKHKTKKIEIECYSDDELDRILSLVKKTE